jgi:hypothetical protein
MLRVKRRQFLRDPMRPLVIALREADEDVGHARASGRLGGALSYREIRDRKNRTKREFQPIRFFRRPLEAHSCATHAFSQSPLFVLSGPQRVEP